MNVLPDNRLVIDERACPADDEPVIQPFMPGQHKLTESWQWLEQGDGVDSINRESLALALSQVTAANVLPPLLDLPTGADLLRYQVDLRDQLDSVLVRELALVIETSWQGQGWEQVGQHSFLCVVGAGVAASLETTPGAERLSLRYASSLANELFHAGQAMDLPRSRLFLQTALYEKINALLALLRDRCWQWV